MRAVNIYFLIHWILDVENMGYNGKSSKDLDEKRQPISAKLAIQLSFEFNGVFVFNFWFYQTQFLFNSIAIGVQEAIVYMQTSESVWIWSAE